MKKRWFGFAALLLACTLAVGCGGSDNLVNVTTAKVKAGSALSSVAYDGAVKAVSSAEIVPGISGKVAGILVKEGQAVKAGDVLFQIDSTDAELQLRQAEAGLNSAKVALATAKASQAADSAVIPAQNASDDARKNYERTKSLFDAGGVSQADLDSAKSRMETADAQLKAAKISQKSTGDSAAAQVASAQAGYDLAAQKLKDCTVTAPIDGRVSEINVDYGSVVSMQAPSMMVVDNSRMKVSVKVLEKDVTRLSVNGPARVTVQSLGKTCGGRIDAIAPSADEKTGLFQVTVEFDPGDSGILSGMMADVGFGGGASIGEGGSGGETAAGQGEGGGASDREAAGESVLSVPVKSIVREDGASYVYLVQGDTVKKQEVTAGARKNQYTEVLSGLSDSDIVVVQGAENLSDGAKIRVIKSN